MTSVNTPPATAQSQYQVRLDWGAAGVARITDDADICVWIDVLATIPRPTGLGSVVSAGLNNRASMAKWILSEQVRRGGRTSIAIIAAGTSEGHFVVEDFLAAGALIDELATLGIDFCSPEAASAAAAFAGLKGAVGHLVTASVNGRELIAAGLRETVVTASKLDSVDSFDEANTVNLT